MGMLQRTIKFRLVQRALLCYAADVRWLLFY